MVIGRHGWDGSERIDVFMQTPTWWRWRVAWDAWRGCLDYSTLTVVICCVRLRFVSEMLILMKWVKSYSQMDSSRLTWNLLAWNCVYLNRIEALNLQVLRFPCLHCFLRGRVILNWELWLDGNLSSRVM